MVSLLVLFVLAWLAGALLAVHGPSGATQDDRPPLTLAPQAPPAPEPTGTAPLPERTPTPAKESGKPARPGNAAPATKITLRVGDTLYALALAHGTTVKTLQSLNGLGTSTLIYAGDTLRLPAAHGEAPPAATSSAGRHAPAPRPAPERTDTPGKPAPVVKGSAATAITFARAQVGKPYIWGGTGPRGYDCSGLVMRAWQKAGVSLPRTTWGQIRAGEATTRARLVPGDLVVSYGGGHVALYIGDGKVIHAPRPGRTVTVAPLPHPSDVVGYRHITR
ncbi:NlpC/P60 family protein [Streptomyces sp. NPDC052015]|uniref:C40 family peptidase n=1 Tax=Streptomyces sp. NPDC052015 TaxID=3154755 RepID=UPI00342E3127